MSLFFVENVDRAKADVQQKLSVSCLVNIIYVGRNSFRARFRTCFQLNVSDCFLDQ